MCVTYNSVSALYFENQNKTCDSSTYTCENKPGYVNECVCVGDQGPNRNKTIYFRERYKEQNEDETDPPLNVSGQSLRVHHSLLTAVHSRYSTLQPASVHPLWA